MGYNFTNNVKLFMVFDILEDTIRSGPLLWGIKRERLEDVKNHILDLILMYRILEQYLPKNLDGMKMIDYMIIHDLPEAITGDITKFEGISEEERKRVNDIAIYYLISRFDSIINFSELSTSYERKDDLEAKIVSLLDAVSSAITFLKYECEGKIDIKSPNIIPELKPYVELAHETHKDIGTIFYEYHRKRIKFSDEECKKYNITREEADYITEIITSFLDEFYNQKANGSLINIKSTFPKSATIYKRFK